MDSVERVACSNLSIRAARFGVERHRNLAAHHLVDVGLAHGRGSNVVGHHALAEIALQEGIGFGHASLRRDSCASASARAPRTHRCESRGSRPHPRRPAARWSSAPSHRARTCRGSAWASRPGRRAPDRAWRLPDRFLRRYRCRPPARRRGRCRSQHQQKCKTSMRRLRVTVYPPGLYTEGPAGRLLARLQMGDAQALDSMARSFCSLRDAPRRRSPPIRRSPPMRIPSARSLRRNAATPRNNPHDQKDPLRHEPVPRPDSGVAFYRSQDSRLVGQDDRQARGDRRRRSRRAAVRCATCSSTRAAPISRCSTMRVRRSASPSPSSCFALGAPDAHSSARGGRPPRAASARAADRARGRRAIRIRRGPHPGGDLPGPRSAKGAEPVASGVHRGLGAARTLPQAV